MESTGERLALERSGNLHSFVSVEKAKCVGPNTGVGLVVGR